LSAVSQGSVKTGEPFPLGYDPLYRVTRGLIRFLKGLFKSQNPGNYQWTEDPVQSEIFITDQSPVNLEVNEKRPAIVTIRGPAAWANLGLGQTVMVDMTTGRKDKQDLISCSMTFACLSREGVEAQRLAWIIFSHLPLFKSLINRDVPGIHNLGNNMTLSGETGAGALVQGSSAPEWKMVQVVVPVSIWHRSSVDAVATEKIWNSAIEGNINRKDPISEDSELVQSYRIE
jgi:hypothetical protein